MYLISTDQMILFLIFFPFHYAKLWLFADNVAMRYNFCPFLIFHF